MLPRMEKLKCYIDMPHFVLFAISPCLLSCVPPVPVHVLALIIKCIGFKISYKHTLYSRV